MFYVINDKPIPSEYSEGSDCSPSVRVSICLFVCLSVCLCLPVSVCSSVHSSVHLSVSRSIGSVNKSGIKIYLHRFKEDVQCNIFEGEKISTQIFNKIKFTDKSVSSLSTKFNS